MIAKIALKVAVMEFLSLNSTLYGLGGESTW